MECALYYVYSNAVVRLGLERTGSRVLSCGIHLWVFSFIPPLGDSCPFARIGLSAPLAPVLVRPHCQSDVKGDP